VKLNDNNPLNAPQGAQDFIRRIQLRIFNSVVLATALAAPFASAATAAPFEGPFVGAQVGWQSEKMRDVKSSFGTVPVDETTNSVTGGIFAGYDKTIKDKFVVGAETGLDFATDDENQTTVSGTNYDVDPKYSFDLTARAGYLVSPETLLYVRGGYTNARIRTTLTSLAGIQSDSDNEDGWLLGAGAERQVAQNVSARVEYRYSKLTQGDGKDQRHRVLAGLSYRF
jgi:outer membrane immunogenic protein